ncbi:Whole genome shotgun assembly, reference scaffold set, scaffold scaffold_150 (fragment) [groundwater metagenome]|uniref:Whole genome shotgun assembly, reference scaffold set, scaffold scaffold_150 n=1 Tax=groundwater metagenome TaxID=717931 RepID=A0A098EDK6_9ZZZZ
MKKDINRRQRRKEDEIKVFEGEIKATEEEVKRLLLEIERAENDLKVLEKI